MEDKEETKQAAKTSPVTQLDQVDSDFALAMALQEQESAFTLLPTIESEGSLSDDDDDESEVSYNDEDYEFFESSEIQAELDLLEREDSNTDMELEEEDDIDPDELSYEELLELGEEVGKENIGLSQDQISACLHSYPWQSIIGESKNVIVDRCVICQVEYEEGEELVALVCEHPYHFDCISMWLQIKKTCPICNTEVSPAKIDS